MTALLWAAATIVLLVVFLSIMSELLYVCEPHEVLILSGGRWGQGQAGEKGYRLCQGGRAWRIPLIERVDRVDMRVMPIEIKCTNAYSEGGIPLDIRAIANVKISSDPQIIGNAIERFLGRPRGTIEKVAKETLEGNLRGVLATMTPEEVNEDRLKFSNLIQTEVHRDLSKLGLEVDTLKIQHIHDSVDYLNSISRVPIARAQREAEVAESDAKRAADNAEAEANSRITVAQQKAEQAIKQKQNELAALESELNGRIASENERTEAAGREARAQAERRLQEIRTELETLRLTAEMVLPAEANQEAERMRAAGAAAVVSERGRATADAFKMLAEVWAEAGNDARDIFLLEKLQGILKTVAGAVRNVKTRQVALVDSGDGKSLGAYVGSYPAIVSSVLDQVRSTLGVDLTSVLRDGAGGPDGSKAEVDLPDDLTAAAVLGLVARGTVKDGKLEEGQRKLLSELGALLGVPPGTVDATVQSALAEPRAGEMSPGAISPQNTYARAYFLALKDRKITDKEKGLLDRLSQFLNLSADERGRLESVVHQRAGVRPALTA